MKFVQLRKGIEEKGANVSNVRVCHKFASEMNISKLQLMKILGLAIGCAAKFTTGSLFVFNVYQDDIKNMFNYTQKEVELMSSMLNLGLGVGFLPGMFYDKFGPQWASTVGLLISVTAYILIWSTSQTVLFYSQNSWLMSIYFFICGLGSVFTYMVALNTNVINFEKKDTGKIVGLLNAFFAGSPSVFASIYYKLFRKDNGNYGSHHDFPGLMILFAVSFAVVDLLCIIFLRIIRNEKTVGYVPFKNEINRDNTVEHASTRINAADGAEVLNVTRNYESMSNNPKQHGDEIIKTKHENGIDARSTSLKEILMSVDYQIFVWFVAFSSSVGLIFVNNITVISKSVHLNSYDDRLTIIVPITNAVLSVTVGLFSDFIQNKLPRIWILIFSGLCFLLSQILIYAFADVLALLVLSAVLVGFGVSILWSLSPTVMQEKFYVGNLGRNWGICILIAAVLGFGAQEAFGALYDSKVKHNTDDTNDNFCSGIACIRGGTAVSIAFGTVSVLLGVLYLFKQRMRRNHMI